MELSTQPQKKSNPYFDILDLGITDQDIAELRQELDPAIQKVEEHFATHGLVTDVPDFYHENPVRRGEVIYCLGHTTPDSQFGYPTDGIKIEVREFKDYYLTYYLYKNQQLANRQFTAFVPKFKMGPFTKALELAERCNQKTKLNMGRAPKTANILRTPPGCQWYRHKDVMNPKIVIPIYSDEKSRFRWYNEEHTDENNYLIEMPVLNKRGHLVNTHTWHTTTNCSDSQVRWNLTFEEPWPMA